MKISLTEAYIYLSLTGTARYQKFVLCAFPNIKERLSDRSSSRVDDAHVIKSKPYRGRHILDRMFTPLPPDLRFILVVVPRMCREAVYPHHRRYRVCGHLFLSSQTRREEGARGTRLPSRFPVRVLNCGRSGYRGTLCHNSDCCSSRISPSQNVRPAIVTRLNVLLDSWRSLRTLQNRRSCQGRPRPKPPLCCLHR